MASLDPLATTLLLAAAMLATVVGTRVYKSFAVSRSIIANPNFRSLHLQPVPRGGGVVFSFVFLLLVVGLWWLSMIDDFLAGAIVLGGAVATTFGFFDDVIEVGSAKKFVVQCLLAAWIMACFGGNPLIELPWTPVLVSQTASWLGLVWLMNLYNFMDGIDGMAGSGAGFICAVLIAALLLTGGSTGLVLVFALLAVCVFGFLVFNWPPASIFMGDSGSLFLGYCFGTLLARTVTAGEVSFWTWLIAFGYFAGDTTTTTLLRMVLVKRWYGAHRSNAYQNLARIWGSHLRVVRLVALYHVLWLFPLAVGSILMPSTGPWAATLAVAPVVLWTFRYGPRLSSA